MKNLLLAIGLTLLSHIGFSQQLPIPQDLYHLYGPNSSWGEYLQVGGNGKATDNAAVFTTNGDLHLQSKADHSLYLNHYSPQNTLINSNGGVVNIGKSSSFVVTDAGKIGVGTDTPDLNAGMHMYQDRYTLYGPNSSWGEYLQIGGNGRVTTNAAVFSTNGNLHLESKETHTLFLNYYSQANTSINHQGGFVGIGAVTPSEKLHVAGNVRADKFIGDGSLLTGIQGLSQWTTSGNDISYNLGNVGIGTTTPAHKLDVSGSIQATAYFTSSDARFKKDMSKIDKAIGLVMQLNGLTYQFKESNREFASKDFPKGTQYGFSAQNVKEIIPELVAADANGYLSVNYIGVIPVLVEALKEQNETVVAMNRKLSQLETELATLRNSNNQTSQIGSLTGINLTATLEQNFPNPFTETTTITYSLPESAKNAQLIIYDLQGKQVRVFDNLQKGSNRIELPGSNLKAGMYIYALFVDGKEMDLKRMVLTE